MSLTQSEKETWWINWLEFDTITWLDWMYPISMLVESICHWILLKQNPEHVCYRNYDNKKV